MQKYPAAPESSQGFTARVAEALGKIISEVPPSAEPVTSRSGAQSLRLAEAAARKAALISGSMAIVPGPAGILTIIPALIQIWKIQRQLVADIAACYGKTFQLGPSTMLYCLFRHGSATVFKETIVQVGSRLLIRQASLGVIHELVKRVSVNITQRVIGQFFSRFVPLVGSAALGAFTYWDTKRVARTAIALFEKDAVIEVEAVPMPPVASSR